MNKIIVLALISLLLVGCGSEETQVPEIPTETVFDFADIPVGEMGIYYHDERDLLEDTYTYLGCLTCPETHLDSILNTSGIYGSPISPFSINNRFGQWGSSIGVYSACSRLNHYPPSIFTSTGEFRGYFSVNRIIANGVCSPSGYKDQTVCDTLTFLCEDE